MYEKFSSFYLRSEFQNKKYSILLQEKFPEIWVLLTRLKVYCMLKKIVLEVIYILRLIIKVTCLVLYDKIFT